MRNDAYPLRHGDQARIAAAVNLSSSFVCDVFRGRRRCPPSLAKYMEEAFGIDRRSWNFPDEFPNPILRPSPPPPGHPPGADAA